MFIDTHYNPIHITILYLSNPHLTSTQDIIIFNLNPTHFIIIFVHILVSSLL